MPYPEQLDIFSDVGLKLEDNESNLLAIRESDLL
jgi:hypothetical protein